MRERKRSSLKKAAKGDFSDVRLAGESVPKPHKGGQVRRSTDGDGDHQLPCSFCALGKYISFHESGFTLIEPTLRMKSTYFIVLFGVVV